MRLSNKKGQEEIAGFVAIVLIVTIIMVIFIGVTLNKKSYDRKNIGLMYYLQSMSQVTSNCSSYGANYRDVADLIRDCHNNRKCSSGANSCEELNNTLRSMMNATLTYGANYSRSGYIFSAIYKFGVKEDKIISIKLGNCSDDYTKADITFSDLPGTITSSMQECY